MNDESVESQSWGTLLRTAVRNRRARWKGKGPDGGLAVRGEAEGLPAELPWVTPLEVVPDAPSPRSKPKRMTSKGIPWQLLS